MKKKDPWRSVSADKFALKKQLKEVTAQRDLLLAALEAVEWMTVPGIGHICPWCSAGEFMGHAPDCQREAAIALVAVTGEQGEEDAQDATVLTPPQFEAAIDGIAERHAAEDAYLLDDEGDDNRNRDS